MTFRSKACLHWPKLVVSCSLVVMLFAGRPVAAAEEQPPNILFFLSDDQRADFIGCAGHPVLQTPTMDRLAADGVRFENMFVTTSICAASRATILTGLYERTHQYTFGKPPLKKQFTAKSYPRLLRDAGYRTGFVGKFGVGVRSGEKQRMFDFFKGLFRHPYFKKQPDGSRRHLSEITGDFAIQFLESCRRKQPFCLSVSFNAPHAEDSDKKDHYPWPKAVDGLYEEANIRPPRLADPEVYENQPDFLKNSLNRKRWFWRWDTPEKYERNVKAYYRMISGVDHVMGRVLKKLEQLGMAENTVVIFSGDNGYYKGSRGFAGKWSHYEESLRVPLIVADPRTEEAHQGRVVEQIALNLDIPATIVALADLEVPTSYQGRSLKPFLKGEQPQQWRSDFFCEHLMEAGSRIPKWEGVRSERYKYARYFEQEPIFEFLYDLKTDPRELNNLADDPDYADVLKQMRSRCDVFKQQYEP